MLTEQTTIAAGIATMARDIGTTGASNQQQQHDMNQELSSLIKRLDDFAPTPAPQPGTGGFETVQTNEGVRRVLTNAPDFLSDPVESPGGRDRGNRGRRD
jgi:hypothetical protein